MEPVGNPHELVRDTSDVRPRRHQDRDGPGEGNLCSPGATEGALGTVLELLFVVVGLDLFRLLCMI